MVVGLLTVALVLVSRRVGAGAGGYGVLLGGFGAGGIFGAMIAARLDAPARWRPLLAIGLTLVAVMLIALSAAGSIASALMLAVIGGGGMIIGEVLADTALPRLVNEEICCADRSLPPRLTPRTRRPSEQALRSRSVSAMMVRWARRSPSSFNHRSPGSRPLRAR
jgi:Transmembrane secretion effector